ncbi:hypothetical protein D6C92_10506 [Aureobasidium pullulans]|nr:hypothetical protein D6C92_10506 [Aureobasidium pullulans]
MVYIRPRLLTILYKMAPTTLSILIAIFGIAAQQGVLAMPGLSTMTMYDGASATKTTTMTTPTTTSSSSSSDDNTTTTPTSSATSSGSIPNVEYTTMSSSAIMSKYTSATSIVMDDMMSSMNSAMSSAMGKCNDYLTYANYYVSVNEGLATVSGTIGSSAGVSNSGVVSGTAGVSGTVVSGSATTIAGGGSLSSEVTGKTTLRSSSRTSKAASKTKSLTQSVVTVTAGA